MHATQERNWDQVLQTWLATASSLAVATAVSASCLILEMCAALSSWVAAAAVSASWRVSANNACASCLLRSQSYSISLPLPYMCHIFTPYGGNVLTGNSQLTDQILEIQPCW